MPNPMKGEVVLQLGGESRTLVYDHNAICELEEMLGKSLSFVLSPEHIAESVGFNFIRKALYCGLMARHGRGLTLPKVGLMMDESPGKLGEWSALIMRAIVISSTGKEPEGAAEKGAEVVPMTAATAA